MLVRKTVSCDDMSMHLWNELGQYVASYDVDADHEMCSFLTEMVEAGHYAVRVADRVSAQPVAVLVE